MILHKPIVRVPILLDGQPVVNVMLNDRGPYRFVLDTGGGHIHLSRHVVDELHLTLLDDVETETDATGATVECGLVRVRSLRLGEAEMTGFVAHVHPPHGYQDDYDGVVGFIMFQQLLVTLDFAAEQMILEQDSRLNPDGKGVLSFVPDASSPEVQIYLNGRPIRVIIDTGNKGGINVPEEVAQTLAFSSSAFQTRGRVAGGPATIEQARLVGEIRIGKHTVENPIVSWFPGKKGHAGVGMEVLRHFVLTFDWINGSIRLSRSSHEPIQMSGFRTSGITFDVFKGRASVKVTVATVNPATPAAALDVRTGDEVLMANSIPGHEFTEAVWHQLHKADVITLTLNRDGRVFTVDAPVVERP